MPIDPMTDPTLAALKRLEKVVQEAAGSLLGQQSVPTIVDAILGDVVRLAEGYEARLAEVYKLGEGNRIRLDRASGALADADCAMTGDIETGIHELTEQKAQLERQLATARERLRWLEDRPEHDFGCKHFQFFDKPCDCQHIKDWLAREPKEA